MNIPVTPFLWGTALLPIIILMLLMTVFKWGAMKAAPTGAAVTAAVGIFFYRANLKVILVESAKGLWSAGIILLIVWTAVLLYQVGNEVHAFCVIRDGMKKFLPDELLLVLALGWIFESFLQGITGFGVPVAVGAPLLIGIGVKPVWAVIIPLLGQSWGNTFGTLGAAWDALAMSADLTAQSKEYICTAIYAALLLWMWNFVIGLSICWFYGKQEAVKRGIPAVFLLSLTQGGGEAWLAGITPTLACFIPACASLGALALIGRCRYYRKEWRIECSRIMERTKEYGIETEPKPKMTLMHAVLPYLILSGLTLLVLLVKPVRTFLGSVSLGLSFPETSTGYGFINPAEKCFSPISPFTHASMFLFLASVSGMIFYRKQGWISEDGIRKIFSRTCSMSMPSGIAVISLVVMSKIMSGTGQTMVLANGISRILGQAYLLFAPFIGLMGSFMTGSNMSSNILFGGFQVMTAKLLDAEISGILGAQTAGGSIGSAISPSNIVLGTTTANILGREGEVLKRTSSIIIPIALAMGILVFLSV